MSLYSELSVLPQEAVFYYKKSSDLPNPIAAPELAWEFIDKYFEKGQKAYVFDFDLRRRFERSDRNVHTAVMFYIGCLWQTQMNQLIKANDPNLLDEYEKDFLHLWFLLCLYHDTSYIHESDFAAVAEIQRNVDLSESFENRIDQVYNSIRDKFEIAHDYVPLLSSDERRPIYDPVTVKKYVLYRLFDVKYGNVLDHGILAGWILFDRLQKNHNNTWEVHSSSPRGEIGVYDDFVYENLQWGKKILVRDAYIADVIVAHNIWISSKKTYRAYKKYKLDDLRKANFERHKISSNPLLVLFSIIDTIEPTKFFCAKTGRAPADFSKQVLEDIDLIFNLTERTITITTNGRLPVSDQDYEDWFIKIKSLRRWLCISVKQINDRKMILTLINT